MEQTERIRQMELLMDQATEAVEGLQAALDKFEAAQEALATLDAYYGSELWLKDFTDDEAGRLPQDLKRGVLSEDGLWNLLVEAHELAGRMGEVPEMLNEE